MLRFETISPYEADKYIRNKRALIIDIRQPEQYEKGHIENAVNIPFERLETQYDRMPRDLILVLYCESGGTSLLAAKELYDRGHVVRAVIGGYERYKKIH